MADPEELPVISGEGDFTYHIPGGHSFRYGTAGGTDYVRWDPDDYDGPGRSHNDTQGDFSVRVGSGYYQPEGPDGLVDTEPEDLEHFSRMIFTDRDAFQDAQTDAINEFFDSKIPPFAGDVSAAGGLTEGMNFAREYFDREMAIRMFLLDVGNGLAALGMAAMFIHFDYVMADHLSGRDGSGGFAGYLDTNVANTFGNSAVQAPSEDSEWNDELAGEWQEELDRQQHIAEEQGELEDSTFDEDDIDSGDRGDTGHTLHEGQDGEYVVGNTDAVLQVDQADSLTVDRDGNATIPGQSSD